MLNFGRKILGLGALAILCKLWIMKKSVCCLRFLGGFLVLLLCGVEVMAQRLPSMDEPPWVGFFSGYKRRGFEFGVEDEGRCLIFLRSKKERKRAGKSKTIKIYTELRFKPASGGPVKNIKLNDDFETQMQAGLNHKLVQFNVMTKSAVKVQVKIKYDANKIIMDGRILERGELEDGQLALVFKAVIPAMYSYKMSESDEAKLSSAMRRDKIRFLRAVDGKKVSLKSYEAIDLSNKNMAKGGVRKLSVSMAGQEGNVFIFTTLDGRGILKLIGKYPGKKSAMWKGYQVEWSREETNRKISPFVIELK